MNAESSPGAGEVVFAALMPHAPILIPDLGRTRSREAASTTNAMSSVATRLKQIGPETVVLISPHSPRKHGSFGIWSPPQLRGSFAQFGAPEIALEIGNDLEFIGTVKSEMQRRGGESWPIRGQELDHGVLVPLWFLIEAGWKGPTVILSLNYPGEGGLRELGEAIASTAARLARHVAVVASGDMSHRLKVGAPAGYDPRAGDFDREFIDHLRRGAYEQLEQIDPELQELAAEDVVDSTLVAINAAARKTTGREVLSYEGPFGVGYGVAVLFDAHAIGDRTGAV